MVFFSDSGYHKKDNFASHATISFKDSFLTSVGAKERWGFRCGLIVDRDFGDKFAQMFKLRGFSYSLQLVF